MFLSVSIQIHFTTKIRQEQVAELNQTHKYCMLHINVFTRIISEKKKLAKRVTIAITIRY